MPCISDSATDPAQYSSVGLRDQTAELASLALSETSMLGTTPESSYPSERHEGEGYPDAIEEVAEPGSSDYSPKETPTVQQVSVLTQMIQSSSLPPPLQTVGRSSQGTHNTDGTLVRHSQNADGEHHLESEE